MKRLLIILALFTLSSPAWGTWGIVQQKSTSACNASPCAVTVSATGAGNLIVVVLEDFALTQRTISSVSCTSSCGTWVLCGATCQGKTTAAGCNASVDMAWVLTSTAGATSVSVTLSGAPVGDVVFVYEFSLSGTASLNAGATPRGVRNQSTSATSVAGVTLTLSAVNSVVIQGDASCGTSSAIDSGYVGLFVTGDGGAYLLNTTSGVAPNWTQTSAGAELVAAAFQESGAAATESGVSKWDKLIKYGYDE
jgi:hypothetical protein